MVKCIINDEDEGGKFWFSLIKRVCLSNFTHYVGACGLFLETANDMWELLRGRWDIRDIYVWSHWSFTMEIISQLIWICFHITPSLICPPLPLNHSIKEKTGGLVSQASQERILKGIPTDVLVRNGKELSCGTDEEVCWIISIRNFINTFLSGYWNIGLEQLPQRIKPKLRKGD